MGGATTAIGRDATLISVNPASAAQISRPALTLAGQRGFFGETLGQIIMAAPLTEGVMTFGAAYYDTGSARILTLDDKGMDVHMQSDFMGSITYSLAPSSNLALGGTVKGLNSRMMEETSSAAFALDAGAQFRINPILKAGISMQNLGTRLRYLDDEFMLPATGRAGIAAGFPLSGSRDLLLATGDAEYALTGQGVTMAFGMEYQWNRMASLRGGIRITPVRELATLSFGTGLVFRNYRFDYSIRMGSQFESPQTFSLTFDFPSTEAPAPNQEAPSPAVEPATTMETTGQAVMPPPTPPPAPAEPADASKLTAPVILPGGPAPLPMAPTLDPERQKELEELLRQTGDK